MLDLAIVVPSRKRPHNMLTIRALLPSATVCVDEREATDYRDLVPTGQLLIHPPLDGYAVVVNWIMDAVKAPILVICDDDFLGIHCRTGSKRFITDADDIRVLIENMAQNCADLELSAFCFSRLAIKTMKMLAPDDFPIKPVGYLANLFGVMGPARHRKLEPGFAGRNAIDLTLRTLLEDRCIYCDLRFYADCGPVFSGRGGNVGIVTTEQWGASTKHLAEKWGKHVSFKSAGHFKKRLTKQVETMKVVVSRFNTRAQR